MTAAAAPPEEPPAEAVAFLGLKGRPCSSFTVVPRKENSGVLVRPMMMAPARRSLETKGASSAAITPLKATTPRGVVPPVGSACSLIVTGTPCSGGSGPPALTALSWASASRRAASPRSSTTALILPLVARMRSTALPTASTAVTRRAAMASARSHALHCHSGLFEAAIARSPRPHVRDRGERRAHAAEYGQARRPVRSPIRRRDSHWPNSVSYVAGEVGPARPPWASTDPSQGQPLAEFGIVRRGREGATGRVRIPGELAKDHPVLQVVEVRSHEWQARGQSRRVVDDGPEVRRGGSLRGIPRTPL